MEIKNNLFFYYLSFKYVFIFFVGRRIRRIHVGPDLKVLGHAVSC